MIAPNQRAPARFVSNESAAAGEDQDVPARLPRLVRDLGQLANVVEGMPVPASSAAAARADGAAPATGTPALVHAWWHAGGAAELLEDPERALSADSCASLRSAMGVPLELVSETGRALAKDVYGHLMEPARREAAEAMQRALRGVVAT